MTVVKFKKIAKLGSILYTDILLNNSGQWTIKKTNKLLKYTVKPVLMATSE